MHQIQIKGPADRVPCIEATQALADCVVDQDQQEIKQQYKQQKQI